MSVSIRALQEKIISPVVSSIISSASESPTKASLGRSKDLILLDSISLICLAVILLPNSMITLLSLARISTGANLPTSFCEFKERLYSPFLFKV